MTQADRANENRKMTTPIAILLSLIHISPQIAALLILFVVAVAAHCLNGQVAVVQIHLKDVYKRQIPYWLPTINDFILSTKFQKLM